MLLVGVDVGVTNLALSVVEVPDDCTEARVLDINLINTQHFEHTRVPRRTCTLGHTGMACDRVAHVVQERQHVFDAAREIVIERQPPGGLRDVEQVFVTMFRQRCHVMAPQTMHAHIGSSGYEYDERKRVSIRVATPYVPDIESRFAKADDVADSVCLVLTRVAQLKKVYDKEHALQVALDRGLDFEQFRYTGRLAQ